MSQTRATATALTLKEEFAAHLSDAELLKRPQGIATGFAPLDSFLESQGIPKAALSLFHGPLGTGATSLWLEAAASVTRSGKWVAWINHDVVFNPLTLHTKGVDLERFVAVETPETPEKLFWLLQELMSSSLFEMIGCDLGDEVLREHQLRKLQVQARQAHVALTFLTQAPKPRGAKATLFSLVLGFEKKHLVIERAQHRPTPHKLERSVSYACFTRHLNRSPEDVTTLSSTNRPQQLSRAGS